MSTEWIATIRINATTKEIVVTDETNREHFLRGGSPHPFVVNPASLIAEEILQAADVRALMNMTLEDLQASALSRLKVLVESGAEGNG